MDTNKILRSAGVIGAIVVVCNGVNTLIQQIASFLVCFLSCVFLLCSTNCRAGTAEQAGIEFFKTGKYKEALDAFNVALPFNCKGPKVLNYYALTLQKLGRIEEAKKAFQQIAGGFSNSTEAVNARKMLGVSSAVPMKVQMIGYTVDAIVMSCIPWYPGAVLVKEKSTDYSILTWHANASKEEVDSYY